MLDNKASGVNLNRTDTMDQSESMVRGGFMDSGMGSGIKFGSNILNSQMDQNMNSTVDY